MKASLSEDPSRWAKLATSASICVALTLCLAKAVVWQRTGSAAILGSLADSVLDLVSSAIAFIGVRMAATPPDANHRFGHDKAEAVSSLVQLVLISGSVVFVLVESLRQITSPEPLRNAGEGMAVMTLSIVLTGCLVAFQTFAVRRSGSLATRSDRAHYMGDFLANAGALIAVFLAARFGLIWIDGLAGIVAAMFLGWSVFEIGKHALPQLMDEELPDTDREAILALVREDAEVRGVHALRTRAAGRRRYIQMHLELDPDLPLRAAHRIADRVERRLHEAFPQADVILHQDPHGLREPHGRFGQPPSDPVV
jgi:ferrous-iron efflux pump FieF